MQTLEQKGGRGAIVTPGTSVVAWGFGRMRPGRIVSLRGEKNAKLELEQNADGTTYEKAVPFDKVFLVEAVGTDVAKIADQINANATVYGTYSQRRTIDHDIAHDLARDYVA